MLQIQNELLCNPYLQLPIKALFRQSTERLTMVRLIRWTKGGITLNSSISRRKGKLITPYVPLQDTLHSLYLIVVSSTSWPSIHNNWDCNLAYIYFYTVIVIFKVYTLLCSCLYKNGIFCFTHIQTPSTMNCRKIIYDLV